MAINKPHPHLQTTEKQIKCYREMNNASLNILFGRILSPMTSFESKPLLPHRLSSFLIINTKLKAKTNNYLS